MEENEEEKREEQLGDDHLQTLTLALFDLLWFRRLILLRPPPPPSEAAPPPPPEVEDAESSTVSPPPPANLLRRRSLHRRSLSDDVSPSPTSSALQIRTPKLQAILSGKEAVISDQVPQVEAAQRDRRRRRRERRRRRRQSSKSMSELEFEELKGFMDLGFTFSDVDADPRLMEIVPGLQRLKAAPDEEASSSCASADDMAVSRPYLSEAWDAAEEEEINQLMNFKIRVGGGGGGGGGRGTVGLKDQLRFWAHAVASTVR